MSSNQILSIYKSRKNILSIMENSGYDIQDYNSFSINEIDAMHSNNQLDMIIENPETKQKSYIKYFMSVKQLKNSIDTFITDLYVIDNVISKTDNLIIITDDDPNDTIIAKIKYLFDKEGYFIVIHNIQRLQYNILEHNLVPACRVLNKQETDEFYIKYNIKDKSQIPEISRFDPQALALCIRPGQIAKFTRNSITALETNYYRVCV